MQMKKEEVKRWRNKKVCIILKNGFRFTGIIPEFTDDTFIIIDKFSKEVAITCDSIGVLYSAKETDGQ